VTKIKGHHYEKKTYIFIEKEGRERKSEKEFDDLLNNVGEWLHTRQ
jgi:hypothetical protein